MVFFIVMSSSRPDSPLGEPPVNRIVTGTGQGQRKRSSEECERELVPVRQEEAVLQMHEQYGADHIDGEEQRNRPGKDSEHEGDAAKELQERDRGTYEARQRDSHLAERAGHSP